MCGFNGGICAEKFQLDNIQNGLLPVIIGFEYAEYLVNCSRQLDHYFKTKWDGYALKNFN